MERTHLLKEICGEVREKIRAADAEISEAQFNRLANRIFAFQFKFNLPYQRFCKHMRRTPEDVNDYRQIPAMVTAAFKEMDLTALGAADREAAFHSSGTTQEKPSRHFHNSDSLGVYHESLLTAFKRFLLPDMDRARFLALTPNIYAVPNSSLVYMIQMVVAAYGEELRTTEYKSLDRRNRTVQSFTPAGSHNFFAGRTQSDGAWFLDYGAVIDYARWVGAGNVPAVICGTAFSFVNLCDHLNSVQQTLKSPAGSRVFETGGYKGRSRNVTKDELHGMIERYLGIPQTHIVSEYGMTELSSQAYDRTVGEDGPRLFRFPPWVRWEIISSENGKPVGEGETGLLRIWDLANVASVLAIQTEDLATRRGDGFVLAGRAAAVQARGCSLMNI